MRKSSFLAVGFVFTAIFAVSAFAQSAAAQPAASGRIGLVNTALFLEDKPGAGIAKYKNAVNSVNAEFKGPVDELNNLGTQYQQQVDAFNKLKNSTAPTNANDLESRATAIQDLETRIKRMQEDLKQRIDRRSAQVVGPILDDIGKAMNDYAKAKGYAVLLDGAQLEQQQILLGFDDKYDVTRDFIVFYNARQGTAAATASTTGPATPPVKQP